MKCVLCEPDAPCPVHLSVADDSLDTMIQKASVPNLATLFQRGKDAGLIQPGKEYGETT